MADPAPTSASDADSLIDVSPARLMWRRFRKHRVAMVSMVVLFGFAIIVIGAEFFATTDPHLPEAQRSLMPPQSIRLFDGSSFNPHVLAVQGHRDPETLKRVYAVDPDRPIPIRLFGHGFEYRLFGLIPTDRHLIGVAREHQNEPAIFLLGTDVQGRDLWSRLMLATRVSMSIGLVGVALSLLIGIVLGGFAGYVGGWVDMTVQRVIEILRSIPTIPLWMGLAAAMPRDWSILRVYFAITIILSLIGWTELARVVRGRFLALREEDFVKAARLIGARRKRIIFRHMLPSFYSHIIAATTVAIPTMIISETALSFLGLGLRAPAVSWGVLLQQAQNVQSVALSPWLMIPALPVIVAVLAFNFVGDGLRDAADPYGQ